jgi:gluconokinase
MDCLACGQNGVAAGSKKPITFEFSMACMESLKSGSAIDCPNAGNRSAVVMGVSGSGKSTVADLLSEQLGWQFIEGDAFHSDANRAKMHAGIALTDTDRTTWLEQLGQQLAGGMATGVILSCSALKLAYRNQLRAHAPGLRFVWLDLSKQAAQQRIAARGAQHFFSPALIDSQYQTLEPPSDEAGVLRVDAENAVADIVQVAAVWLTEGRVRFLGAAR